MKFMVTIDSRDANSDEMTAMDLLLKMRNHTVTEPIKIFNKENTNHISSLTYIDILEPENNKIVLDNSLFRRKKIKIIKIPQNCKAIYFVTQDHLNHTILRDV